MKTHFHRFYITLSLILGLVTAGSVYADTIPASDPTDIIVSSDRDTVCIHFRQSGWDLQPQLGDNPTQLQRLRTIFGRDGKVYSGVNGIKVLGSASPEGPYALNRRLSHHRADAIHSYLDTLGEFPDSLFSFEYLGRDWPGLRELVQQDSLVPGHEEVMMLLDDLPLSGALTPHEDDALLARLKGLEGGRTYAYLYTHLFPQLRATRVVVDYPLTLRRRDRETARLLLMTGPDLTLENLDATPSGTLSSGDLTVRRMRLPFYMSIGTNLLYDAAALPTVRLEFYLSHNWSIGGNWTYGWWDSNHLHRYWRAYGGDIAVRRWFGKAAMEKPLTGHHLGLYGGIVTYDFEWGGTGYMGGLPEKTLWDRCNYMAGVEYGYSLPVGHRLNIDFTVGIGCLWGKYIKYDPVDGYYQYRSTHNLRWFGPTKAEISLVWLIGRGNYNK